MRTETRPVAQRPTSKEVDMRVCDKCETRLLYTTFKNMKDSSEIDLCTDCYQLFADWVYNHDRTKEGDPVVEAIIDKPKQEVKNARRSNR